MAFLGFQRVTSWLCVLKTGSIAELCISHWSKITLCVVYKCEIVNRTNLLIYWFRHALSAKLLLLYCITLANSRSVADTLNAGVEKDLRIPSLCLFHLVCFYFKLNNKFIKELINLKFVNDWQWETWHVAFPLKWRLKFLGTCPEEWNMHFSVEWLLLLGQGQIAKWSLLHWWSLSAKQLCLSLPRKQLTGRWAVPESCRVGRCVLSGWH